jgi:hypothetical protein
MPRKDDLNGFPNHCKDIVEVLCLSWTGAHQNGMTIPYAEMCDMLTEGTTFW